MPLNKTQLKTDLTIGLKQIFSNPSTVNNVDKVAEAMATLIADKMETFVKTGNAVGADSNGATHNLSIV